MRRPAALALGEAIVFAQCAVGASLIAFGGLSWALDGSARRSRVLRLEPAMASAGALPSGNRLAKALPARAIRSANLVCAPGGAPVLEIRPDDSRGLVAGHRGPERRRQDDARQAALPPL